jgi:CheY-like chemotaxis protein
VDQRHVLVVDDIKLFQDIMRGYLATSDVTVAVAANGQEALDQVNKRRPDIIYMDLHMPDMPGDVCCRLLKTNPEFSDIPIIMVIASGKDADHQSCIAAGCNAIITKPINRRVFLNCGNKYLHGIDRRDMRYEFQTTVVISDSSQTYYGICKDISFGGLYLASDQQPAIDERLTLTIIIEGDVLDVWGRVAWCNFSSQRVKPCFDEGFGIEFLDMSPVTADKLHYSMNRLSQQGGERESL